MATLSQRGQAPTTVARKLASLRGLLAIQVTRGERSDNPAELLSAPKRPQRLPRVLKPDEVAALLDRIPATTPLALRDRALFELAYASGLRAEELVTLEIGSIGFDEETVRVHGKGDKTRIVPAGEHALRAIERYLAVGRPALRAAADPAADGGDETALFVSKSGRRLGTSDVRRRLRVWARLAARESPALGRCAPACAAAFVCDTLIGGWRRPPCNPGVTRSFQHFHYTGLHSGAARPPSDRICGLASPSVGRTWARLDTKVKTVELHELWRRYKSDGDARARERLVIAYSPIVKYVAGRLGATLPAHVEEADLISYGLGGLISAIERYDPGRETKFETYAMTRIRGAIIDELRTLDWAPRSVRARARQIERVNVKLESRLQRAPTDDEMAAELGTTTSEFHEHLLQIANSTIVALDELWSGTDAGGDQVSLLDTLADQGAPDPQIVGRRIRAARAGVRRHRRAPRA